MGNLRAHLRLPCGRPRTHHGVRESTEQQQNPGCAPQPEPRPLGSDESPPAPPLPHRARLGAQTPSHAPRLSAWRPARCRPPQAAYCLPRTLLSLSIAKDRRWERQCSKQYYSVHRYYCQEPSLVQGRGRWAGIRREGVGSSFTTSVFHSILRAIGSDSQPPPVTNFQEHHYLGARRSQVAKPPWRLMHATSRPEPTALPGFPTSCFKPLIDGRGPASPLKSAWDVFSVHSPGPTPATILDQSPLAALG
jgi:hypothetical protein